MGLISVIFIRIVVPICAVLIVYLYVLIAVFLILTCQTFNYILIINYDVFIDKDDNCLDTLGHDKVD